MSSTCAMCSDRLVQPRGGYSLPAVCVQLLDGGDDIDPSTIAGKVSVDFCENCTSIARRMVRDYETSPLPECDADAASWQNIEVVNALARDDPELSEMSQSDGVDRRTITDAITTVKAHRDGDADRVMAAKIDAAYITLWSLRELGIVESSGFGIV